MDELILASSSLRRRDLLSQVGIPFRVVPSDVDESGIEFSGAPEEKAERLALMKAMNVAGQIGNGLVLGADTIVVCDGEVFGKPTDANDARRMLGKLNGREHMVITGIALVDAEKMSAITGHEITRVRFSTLSPEEIEAYIATGEPFDKAGAYAIQGKGAFLAEGIYGCYSNVVGLPLNKLYKMLKELGVKLLG